VKIEDFRLKIENLRASFICQFTVLFFATKTLKHKDKFYQTVLLCVFVAIFPVCPGQVI